MFHNRLQGFWQTLALLRGIATMLWFASGVVFAVEWLGLMNYSQVAWEVYLPAIAVAFLVRLSAPPSEAPHGPIRNFWVSGVRVTNADMLMLVLVVFAVIYATKDKAISRQFVGMYLVSSWLLLLLLNRFMPQYLAGIVFHKQSRIRTILVGSAERASLLSDWIESHSLLGIELCGIVTWDRQPEDAAGLPALGAVDDLESIIADQQIQQVVLLESRNNRSWVQFIVDICQRNGSRILIYNAWQDFLNRPMASINEGGISFFALQEEPLQNPLNRLIKRLLDIAIALPVCLLVLPPLAAIVWLVQRRQAPGPLLFRQQRTGEERRPFAIYKFRTMFAAPADESRQASADDPRIYPFGSFLRRSSLDEFPQFLNVLQGTMSVVGPRPHLIAHDDAFARQMDIYRDRHFAKPGITGLAQNRGWRGEIRSIEEINNRIQLDLHYIFNWSIWLDLGIIIKTFWQVLFPPPRAY
jgi:exopolysaccharide biosynthesis polyprenyl glycosylphosphotransferase